MTWRLVSGITDALIETKRDVIERNEKRDARGRLKSILAESKEENKNKKQKDWPRKKYSKAKREGGGGEVCVRRESCEQ